jgi:hypothetical protein
MPMLSSNASGFIALVILLIAIFGSISIVYPHRVFQFLEWWTGLLQPQGRFNRPSYREKPQYGKKQATAIRIIRLGGIFCLIWLALLAFMLLNSS